MIWERQRESEGERETWWEVERGAVAGEAETGGISDQVSRSAVDVCGFLTGVVVFLSIVLESSLSLTHYYCDVHCYSLSLEITGEIWKMKLDWDENFKM